MNWLTRMKIMPLLALVAALSFGVRFGDFMTGVSSDPGTAQAKDVEPKTVDEPAPEGGLIEEAPVESDAVVVAQADLEEEPRTAPVKAPSADGAEKIEPDVEWKDSTDSDLEYSEVRMELFEDLAARRKDLAGRERELAVREALLQAAEQEIDQKYKELVSLRSEIQDLLVEQSEEEKERIASLVKIYEGMKPKDAARIFNSLDLDILLHVVSQMSERKSAPIIASMTAERAQTLTMMLMEQKSLPNIADEFARQ